MGRTREKNIERSKQKFRLTRKFISDIKSYGPAGLMHVALLSVMLKQNIRIWMKDKLEYEIIGNRNLTAIDIEFHPVDPETVGHWTLKGGKEPLAVEVHLNGCLFGVIAAQMNTGSNQLRHNLVNMLEKNWKWLAKQVDHNKDLKKINKLMLGGGKYSGRCSNDAKIILDNSQNVLCAGCREYGHPRGHASCPTATGELDSVENYSRTGRKSGFLSRGDQDMVAHLTLIHPTTQGAMNQLNNGSQSEAVTLNAWELTRQSNQLPKMKEFYQGHAIGPETSISRVTIVLRHHQNERNNKNADVFVHTFYPRAS